MAREFENCLQCNKKLVGRDDQKYCDLKCKNEYHRKNKTNLEEAQERIIKILKRNQQVLKDVLGEKNSMSIDMDKLIAQGLTMTT